MNTFKVELIRALSSRGFAAGTAGFVVCALMGAWRPVVGALQNTSLQEPGYVLLCISDALESRYLMLALPLIASLPYAGSFVEDLKSRFLRSYIPRTGTASFLVTRTAGTALSGAAVIAAGSFAATIVLTLMLMPSEMRPDPLQMQDTEAMKITLSGEVLQKVLLLSLSGAFWALVGALLAAASMNQNLAVAGPFIFFYVLVILSTRFFPGTEVLNPELWASGSGIWLDAPLTAALLVCELILAAGAACTLVMERRLQNV